MNSEDLLCLLADNESLPCRTDLMAYRAGFKVSPLDSLSKEKSVFHQRSIKYSPSLPPGEIRSLIALGILLLTNPLIREEVVISKDEEIYNSKFRFFSTMNKVSSLLITKENIEMYLYDFKVYQIQRLAVEFGVSEEMMYHRLKELKKL